MTLCCLPHSLHPQHNTAWCKVEHQHAQETHQHITIVEGNLREVQLRLYHMYILRTGEQSF